MTAKEYLSQIRTLDFRIRCKQDELIRLETDAERITPAGNGGGFGGVTSDRVGNAVAKIADLRNEIADDIIRLADLRHEVIEVIYTLNDSRYEQLLYKRYVEGKSLKQISREMAYSQGTIRMLHVDSLRKFEKVMTQNDIAG